MNPIPENKKILSITELREDGYSQYKINRLVDEGILTKLNRKFYENMTFTGNDNDFYYAYAYASNGIICLLSAAVYYELSTFRPDAIDVAIPRKSRVSTLPEWPELRLHYFTDDRYSAGIIKVSDGENTFRIYDIEKTVADIVYNRREIGSEDVRIILTNYLERPDRNLNRLIRYAELLKCDDILKTYLEVLV